MKQVICPKCGKTFSFDESRYDASCNISFICPACRKRFLRTLPEIDACHKNDIDTSLGFITVLENAFGYRQEFPLHAGDNIIGRASKGTEVDIPIETSDMSMDRRHCIINVKEKAIDRYSRSETIPVSPAHSSAMNCWAIGNARYYTTAMWWR